MSLFPPSLRLLEFGVTRLVATGILSFTNATVHTDTFGGGDNTFTIDFVTIGNAGNADDTGEGGGLYSSPYGGVSYEYRMGVTEVPRDWITKASNLGLKNVSSGPWTGYQPATWITWNDAAAFVNWLNTSTGHHAAYQVKNTGPEAMTLWSSGDAWQLDGENLYRHKDAYYFLPSEDEWYKAAYHQNDGVTANYWDYATGSNSIPTEITGGTGVGTAVYHGATNSPVNVDNNGGLSAYGTRGQNGNVFEWQESAFDGTNDIGSENRTIRGGEWSRSLLQSSRRFFNGVSNTDDFVGFRVASVPEPSSTVLMLSASLLAYARRRRRAGVLCRFVAG